MRFISNKVSEAFGWTQNNSECYVLPTKIIVIEATLISAFQTTIAKITQIRITYNKKGEIIKK